MNVYIIGVGPGNGQYLIKESEEKIENADIIIGAKRLKNPASSNGTPVFADIYDTLEIPGRILYLIFSFSNSKTSFFVPL